MDQTTDSTLLHLLARRAEETPDKTLYQFLEDGEREGPRLSFSELFLRSRALAGELHRASLRGERALLLFPPGLEFIIAFFGCLMAGVIAVPAYPPTNRRGLPRLMAISSDARPAVVLTTGGLAPRLRSLCEGLAELRASWMTLDLMEQGASSKAACPLPPAPEPQEIAFLQYTSGSTADPKGVVVSHGNLLHNSELIRQAFEMAADSVVVGWLPLYHDMGLIGNVLQPLYAGASCFLMAPVAFLSRPARWLEAISRYRATVSGGPNFAYEQCRRRISPEELAPLDLSCWRVAFNGAEPVRSESLERFAETFASYGFRQRAFYPCYGLAEATLFVAGGRVGRDPLTVAFDEEELARGRGVEVASGGRRLVSCGVSATQQRVAVVDPESRRERSAGEVGEIWVHGPSVAQGYWQDAERTGRDFGQCLVGGAAAEGYLRTGDLGFLHGGELYVTGRIKDLIVIRGRNLYPQDIELSAERAHVEIRPGCGAAFAVEVGGEERVVLLLEKIRHGKASAEEVAAAVRQAVAEEHEVRLHEVVLLRTGSLLKTSSGKVRRTACRLAYLANELAAVGRVSDTESPAVGEPWESGQAAAELSAERLAALPALERRAALVEGLRHLVAGIVRSDVARIATDQGLGRFGLDSLGAVELKQDVESRLGGFVPLDLLLAGATIEDLAEDLLTGRGAKPGEDETPIQGVSSAALGPLSEGQKALWFLDRLAPASGAYHVLASGRVRPRLDVSAWRRALARLAARHSALRTTFEEHDGEPRRRLWETLTPELRVEEAAGLNDEELQEHLLSTGYEPFDLAAGPLLRVLVLRRGPEEDLILLAMHHIVTDFWSLAVLARELGAFYLRELGEPSSAPSPLTLSYDAFVHWQRERCTGAWGLAAGNALRERLAPPLPVTELPGDRPRPPLQTYAGAVARRRLGVRLSERVLQLSREHGCTLFTTLLVAFQGLLHRHTGQEDLLVGSPTAGRTRRELDPLVGYFVNPVVLRSRTSAVCSFAERLATGHRTVIDALAGQDYPFPLLAQQLEPERDPSRSPVFQVLFTLQRAPRSDEAALASFALGIPGGRLELGGLEIESLALDERAAPFDLSLRMADVDGSLGASLLFNRDLFDSTTAQRFLGHFVQLLDAAARAPERPFGELPMLGAGERGQLLVEWNDTVAELTELTVHELIERRAAGQEERTALVAMEEGTAPQTLSYGDLLCRAERLAHELRRRGVGPETLVGVATGRGPEMVVALLGILKAGGAYLPLDLAHPEARLAWMLEDSGARHLVSTRDLEGRLPPLPDRLEVLWLDRLAETAPSDGPVPRKPAGGLDRLAYVIYTSGSTGRPKGVEVSHRALSNFLLSMASEPGLESRDVLVAVTTLSFDIAALELFLPLVVGARLVLASRAIAGDAGALARLLESQEASVLQATPASWQLLLRSGWGGRPALRALCGGEALTPDLARRLRSRVAELWNVYGPTETTVWSTLRRIDEADLVTVGRPIANTRVHLLDPGHRLVPTGVSGELWIGGTGVTRGYRGRPALTAERFVPDPWSRVPGARLYRTGDLARFRSDGTLEVLGRLDHQVKVRGFRIEPGEIETALVERPEVAEAVVVAREVHGDLQLVAYVRPAAGEIEGRRLRAELSDRLPEYMVPAFVVSLDKLPKTPNGKIDRAALPDPEVESRGGRAPQTPVEELLAGLWSEVLGLADVRVDDNFFELGGHSLKATQVMSRLQGQLGVDLPLARLFEAPTVARLAKLVETSRCEEDPMGPVTPAADADRGILSFAQQRLWFLDQLEPGSPLYNVVNMTWLEGELRLTVLAAALGEVLKRHESLRTVFQAEQGRPRQVVSDHVRLPLVHVDLRRLEKERGRQEAKRLARSEGRRPLDLARAPLLRLAVLTLEQGEHVLLSNLHHIVADGWSMGVLLGELIRLYGEAGRADPSALPALPVQYADFAVWQNRWRETADFERQLAYWKDRLAGFEPWELPADRPRRPVATPPGRRHPVCLDPERTRALRLLARAHGVTLFMVLLAAFQHLLGRSCRVGEVTVGSPVAGRRRPELEGLIGFFANTLVLRVEAAGHTGLPELLAETRETALGAYAHQDLPFEILVEELQPERDLGRNPLFPALLVLQNAPLPGLDVPGMRWRPEEVDNATAKFDLTLSLLEDGEGLAGYWESRCDLFDATTALRMARSFGTLLDSWVAQPTAPLSAHGLLDEAERHQTLTEWNAPAGLSAPAELLEDVLTRQAEERSDTVALSFAGTELSYGELDRLANRLARRLQRLGVGPSTPVGLHLERSPELLIGFAGILKSGGACVPLDPAYPAQRLAWMLEEADLPILLTTRRLLSSLPKTDAEVILLDAGFAEELEEESEEAPATTSGEGDLLYIIYTSGSTGRPKGVAIPRGVLGRLLAWQAQRSTPGPLKTLQLTSMSFDVFYQETLSTWLSGATLVGVTQAQREDPEALLALLEREGIERLFLPFVGLQQLAEAAMARGGAGCPREIVTAGEALQITPAIASWLGSRPGSRLHNQYGPSESHVVTALTLTGSPRSWPLLPPIGRPIPGARVFLADGELRPVPIGVAGELLIAGAALARGYLKQPRRSAESFLPDPFSGDAGARLYRTGDLARCLSRGEIEFLGRIDDQVKIRGFRVEPGEVEAALSAHPQVLRAAVVSRRRRGAVGSGGEQLVAYFVAAEAASPPDAQELSSFLRASLPEYLVPSFFHALPEMPFTPSGKVDRRNLPELRETGRQERTPPRGPVEAALAEIWTELLDLDGVGVEESFFELGGHSLLATQLLARIRGAFQLELPVRAIFESPTIAALAKVVESSGSTQGGASPGIHRRPSGAPGLLSSAQQRLWFLSQLEGQNVAYNLSAGLRLQGDLDFAALAASLDEVVRRHEALRTVFVVEDGEARQQVLPHRSLGVSRVDLDGLPVHERSRTAENLATALASQPFDLARWPLLRGAVLRLAEREHLFVLVIHHVVADGWSLGNLLRELEALYTAARSGEASPLPELALQYPDYAWWERGEVSLRAEEVALGYWKQHLAGLPPVLEMVYDRPRPARSRHRGARYPLRLASGLRRELDALGRRVGATSFMTVATLTQLWLWRHSGQDDLPLGFPVARRDHSETEDLIGFFVNFLVLRTEIVGSASFVELLAQVQEATLAAYEHQDLPFDRLVEELGTPRGVNHHPVFQAVLAVQNIPLPAPRLAGLDVSVEEVFNRTSKFDLLVELWEAFEPSGHLEYDSELFDATTVGRMAGRLERLAAAVVEAPEQAVAQLAWIPEAEAHQLSVEWNDTSCRLPQLNGIHELFREQASRSPDALALRCGEASMTYRELERRANYLAHGLRRLGVDKGARIGIFMGRSPEMIVALLAILKSGGAYVPLDASYPKERLVFMARDAGLPMVLVDEEGERRLPAGLEQDLKVVRVAEQGAGEASPPPPGRTHGEDLAYCIYTSGSTGRPKGVAVTHRNVVRLVWEANFVHLGPEETFLQLAPVSFDAATLEIWAPLVTGGCLEIAPEGRFSLEDLAELLKDSRVTSLWLTAGLFHQMASSYPEALGSVRQLLAGGDVLSPAHVRRVLAEGQVRTLINGYGPTEGTTFTSCSVMKAPPPAGRSVSIGRPITNTTVMILDRGFRPVPLGVVGELCAGGLGLARGYLDRPSLTASRFVPDARSGVAGARLYRTGDLARWLPDATIDFLGRMDHQVKIRGFRIELAEIEVILTEHPGLEKAVAVALGDRGEEKRLVAYTVPTGEPPSVEDLRAFLAARLPGYMVPSVFISLDVLPLDPNGKVDRRALPAPEGERPDLGVTYLAPRTPLEEELAEIWKELLGVERVGVRDDFFALGGHSLMATRLLSRLRESFAVEQLSLADVFERPTVEELALRITSEQAAAMVNEGEQDLVTELGGLSPEEIRELLAEELGQGG